MAAVTPWALKYFGVGNENWGCGGRMTAEYYADLYRRYGTYARNYGENRLYRIACGASNEDYHWTEVMMAKAGHDQLRGGPYMDGLALHYYTSVERLPDGTRRGAATQFDEAEWIEIISKGLFMDELVRKHSTIMDKYDPAKKVATDRRRVGYMVRGRAGHAPALPLPAEHHARRHRGGDNARHF